MTELLLGIDVGTGSTKGVVARPDGELVASAERAHRLDLPHPGWAEMDAEEVWWGDVLALCRQLVGQTASAGRIAAVCVSGMGPCALVADAEGRPLRPAILYGIDTRAGREIEELTERLGADALLARGGSPLTSQAVGPKLAWLRRHEPEVWARTRRLFMPSSYAVRKLTCEYVLDHHSASQCDPLYDLAGERWVPEWAEEIAPGLELPRLLWPGEVAGTVTTAAAAATGLPIGIPVAAGTIDAWAEALSVGVQRPGELMLMYGSTMFLVHVARDATPDPRLWLTAGVQPHTRTLAAGMATSGSLTAWFRELAGDVPFETLTAEAAEVPPGARGVLALPYFAGERTPLFDPDARGLVLGLTLSHGRADLYRALLEATAYGVRHNLAAIAEVGGEPERVVAVGGGTRGALWTQIVSDVTGRPQEVPAVTIGASYGDALLAARAVGLAAPDADWSRPATVVEPSPSAAAVHDELFETYLDLYRVTRPLAGRLAAVQRASAGPATGTLTNKEEEQ